MANDFSLSDWMPSFRGEVISLNNSQMDWLDNNLISGLKSSGPAAGQATSSDSSSWSIHLAAANLLVCNKNGSPRLSEQRIDNVARYISSKMDASGVVIHIKRWPMGEPFAAIAASSIGQRFVETDSVFVRTEYHQSYDTSFLGPIPSFSPMGKCDLMPVFEFVLSAETHSFFVSSKFHFTLACRRSAPTQGQWRAWNGWVGGIEGVSVLSEAAKKVVTTIAKAPNTGPTSVHDDSIHEGISGDKVKMFALGPAFRRMPSAFEGRLLRCEFEMINLHKSLTINIYGAGDKGEALWIEFAQDAPQGGARVLKGSLYSELSQSAVQQSSIERFVRPEVLLPPGVDA